MNAETYTKGGQIRHKTEWHKTSEELPPIGIEVEITHPQFIGTRTAKLYGISGWHLTDCTYPAMNAYAPLENSGWRHLPNGQKLRHAAGDCRQPETRSEN